jgi:serine/threonine protein kinase
VNGPDSTHPRPGRIIAGKYQLDSVLGEGAMGTVWCATHLFLHQKVAVKLILPELADSDAARARFDAEAKAAAALRSRFVVQIFDSGITDGGVPYLVMEYLTGEPLEDRVERTGPLSVEHAVQVIGQVARGLSRAHAEGIVHRDLKPANVFLAESEDGEHVAKILDFGIAKVQRGGAVSATATGAVIGTPLFMSPEQARGSKTVDFRSDLYSLGMVTYWALTGTYAFGGDALGELIISICTHPLPSLVAARPELPARMDWWFARACARDPNERFESADAFLDALVEASGVSQQMLLSSGILHRPRGDQQNGNPSEPEIFLPNGSGTFHGIPGAGSVGATATGVVHATAAPATRSSKVGLIAAVAAVFVLGAFVLVAIVIAGALRFGRVSVAATADSPPETPASAPAATTSDPAPERSATPPPPADVTASAPAPASAAPETASAAPASAVPSQSGRTPPQGTSRPYVAPRGPVVTRPLGHPRPAGSSGIDIGF